MTPKEFLSSYVKEFNAKNVSSLMDMYETGACFVIQPGQVVNGLENIRQSLQVFIDMNGNLQSNVKGVVQTSNLALVTTEWSFSGTGPDKKSVDIGGKATDILRRQSDGTWRILIDNPWGTDLSVLTD
jgi:ketosteroid isomerase-like protein